jgi:flagella basal body P-ring formation protein FlgA
MAGWCTAGSCAAGFFAAVLAVAATPQAAHAAETPARSEDALAQAAATAPLQSTVASIAQALALTRQNVQVPAGARVEVLPGELDPRLKLAPCARIEPHLPAGSRPWGRTRVGLRCVSGPVRWNVYLPLTVRVWAPAVVSAGDLPAGHTLTAADLRMAEVDLAAAPSPVHAVPAEIIGRTLATALSAGAAVRADTLRQRQWFQAGDTVTVIAQGAGYAVSGEGQALAHGIEGQPVRIRTESGRILTAIPVGTRRVEVPL